MSKKFWLIGLGLITLTIAACNKTTNLKNATLPGYSVPETGRIIDLKNSNRSLVWAEPGDIIKVELADTRETEGFQWSLRQPISGGYLTLKNHQVGQAKLINGQDQGMTNWEFKIEKLGMFELILEYNNPLKQQPEPTQFRSKIANPAERNSLKPLLIDPLPNSLPIELPLTISGYLKLGAGTLNYRLKNNAGQVIIAGNIPFENSSETWHYFSKEILRQKPKIESALLEIYTLGLDGKSESQIEVYQLTF